MYIQTSLNSYWWHFLSSSRDKKKQHTHTLKNCRFNGHTKSYDNRKIFPNQTLYFGMLLPCIPCMYIMWNRCKYCLNQTYLKNFFNERIHTQTKNCCVACIVDNNTQAMLDRSLSAFLKGGFKFLLWNLSFCRIHTRQFVRFPGPYNRPIKVTRKQQQYHHQQQQQQPATKLGER